MVPGYQKVGKLTGSPSGTTVVVLVPSWVVACLFIWHLWRAYYVPGTVFHDRATAVIYMALVLVFRELSLGKNKQVIPIKCHNQENVINNMPWEAQRVWGTNS